MVCVEWDSGALLTSALDEGHRQLTTGHQSTIVDSLHRVLVCGHNLIVSHQLLHKPMRERTGERMVSRYEYFTDNRLDLHPVPLWNSAKGKAWCLD